jgi:hypothetical protein
MIVLYGFFLTFFITALPLANAKSLNEEALYRFRFFIMCYEIPTPGNSSALEKISLQ